MRRFAATLVLTGIGYAATLSYTYALVNWCAAETVALVNQYEGAIAIIASLTTLGVTQNAARKIALNDLWQPHYYEAQRFRIALSLLITAISLMAYLATSNELCLLGLSSLAMSLSGEYGLYAMRRPVAASLCSLLRALSFAMLILLWVSFAEPSINSIGFSLIWALSFVVCGVLSARLMGVRYLIAPGLPNRAVVRSVGLIAVIVFIYNSLKPAYVFLIQDALSAPDRVYYFEFYKLFFIAFSVQRVIIQVYYKDIVNSGSSLRYDLIVFSGMLAVVAGLCVLGKVLEYSPVQFVGLTNSMLRDVAIVALLSSVMSTSFTKLFSLQRDWLLVWPVLSSIILVVGGVAMLRTANAGVGSYIYLVGLSEFVLSAVSFLLLRAATRSRPVQLAVGSKVT